MTCDEVKPLVADYWAGNLEGAEQVAYETHLESCDSCRVEVARLDTLWHSLALLPREEPGGAVRGRFYDTLRAYRQGMDAGPRWRWPVWLIAAAAALLLIGVAAGYLSRSNQRGEEVAELRGEVASMRQLVALSLLQQQSASARLRGVSWAYRAEPGNTEVLDALVAAVNHDTSVNVRLAAVDALHTFGASPATRRAIVESLPRQATPLVQVALIDLLVDLKEREAATELRALAGGDSVNDGVKQRALWALERLQ